MDLATTSLGSQLERLCSGATAEIVLTAPFMKVGAVSRLLTAIPEGISLRCVTRWLPDEIAVGVSDLDIWLQLRDRPGASLWLRTDLHAKYFRVDQRALIGSANLTGAALGWSPRSNFELLVEEDARLPELQVFERELFLGTVPVDDSLYGHLKQTVTSLLPDLKGARPVEDDFGDGASDVEDVRVATPEIWLPCLRQPQDLFLAYEGRTQELSTASRYAAGLDLMALPLPRGLARQGFEAIVGSLLLQKPVVAAIDGFLVEPRRFGAVSRFISKMPCALLPDFDPDRAWQTLMRWLQHFLPGRYQLSIPRHTEVIARRGPQG